MAFSVKRIIDPAFASPQLSQFNKIVNAEVTGPSKVTLTTDGAYPALLAQLVKLSVLPKETVEKVGKDAFNLNPLAADPINSSAGIVALQSSLRPMQTTGVTRDRSRK